MIVGTDVLVMPILHPKAARDCPKLNKTKTFIKMPRMDIALYNRIELKHMKTQDLCGFQAVQYQLFTNVLSSA